MKKQTTIHAAERAERLTNSLSSRLERLCAGSPENRFDAWLRKNFYPVLAVCHVMPLGVDEKMYERRLAELLEGEPENEYDAWLRDRFYPIVVCFTVSDSCGWKTRAWKTRVALKDDVLRE